MNIISNKLLYTLGKAIKADLKLLKSEYYRITMSQKRQILIQHYLESNAVRKLHLGCGPNLLSGWLNTDIRTTSPTVVYVDILEPLPFPDRSFDFIYSEHLIEHIPFASGLNHLSECLRVLRPKGTIRISTPNMQFLLDYYQDNELNQVQRKYLERTIRNAQYDKHFCHPTTLMNIFMHEWEHKFIYDHKVLSEALKFSGFYDIRHCAVNESEIPELRGLEQHGTSITDEFNILQSMLVEATKKTENI